MDTSIFTTRSEVSQTNNIGSLVRMTFKFKTKVKTFKAVITAFTTAVEELTFSITPEQIRCKARDPSHVMHVDVIWGKDQFESYECTEPKEFGIIITDMNKILKRFADDETLDVAYNDQGLLILKTLKKEYELRLVAPNTEEKIPNAEDVKAEFTCNFDATMSALNAILDDVSAVDEYVTFRLEDKKLYGSGGGATDSAKGNIEFLDNVEGTCKGTYSLSYLQGTTKGMGSFADRVSISLSMDMLLRLKIFITDKLILTYLLAPKK